jgi:hypothetical protein
MNLTRALDVQRLSGSLNGCAGRQHIVDEQDTPRWRIRGLPGKSGMNILSPLDTVEVGLLRGLSHADKLGCVEWQLRLVCQPLGQKLRLVKPAHLQSIVVERYRYNRINSDRMLRKIAAEQITEWRGDRLTAIVFELMDGFPQRALENIRASRGR